MTGREKSGPEKYAPPDRRAPKKRSDVDQCDPAPEKLNELIRRVAGASAEEIDQVILELQRVRDMLDGEGERLSREIAPLYQLTPAIDDRDESHRRKSHTMERRLREP